jgi:hypothetical protein
MHSGNNETARFILAAPVRIWLGIGNWNCPSILPILLLICIMEPSTCWALSRHRNLTKGCPDHPFYCSVMWRSGYSQAAEQGAAQADETTPAPRQLSAIADDRDLVKLSGRWWGQTLAAFPELVGWQPGDYTSANEPGAANGDLKPNSLTASNWTPQLLTPSIFHFEPSFGLFKIEGLLGEHVQASVVGALTIRYGQPTRILPGPNSSSIYIWDFDSSVLRLEFSQFSISPSPQVQRQHLVAAARQACRDVKEGFEQKDLPLLVKLNTAFGILVANWQVRVPSNLRDSVADHLQYDLDIHKDWLGRMFKNAKSLDAALEHCSQITDTPEELSSLKHQIEPIEAEIDDIQRKLKDHEQAEPAFNQELRKVIDLLMKNDVLNVGTYIILSAEFRPGALRQLLTQERVDLLSPETACRVLQ